MMLCCKTQQKLLLIQIFVKKKFYAPDKLILSNKFAAFDSGESKRVFNREAACDSEGLPACGQSVRRPGAGFGPFVRVATQSEAYAGGERDAVIRPESLSLNRLCFNLSA